MKAALFGPVILLGHFAAFPATAQTVKMLHYFSGEDGAYPRAGLVAASNNLYGTTTSGGTSDGGTVFKVNIDRTGFTVFHYFAAPSVPTNTEGVTPTAALVLSGGTLYGTTAAGGSLGHGTVFALNTDGSGFRLQSTTNLTWPTWTSVVPAPVIVNGQYTVTISISSTEHYFRLKQ